jgi:hypothetical protein
MFVHGIKTKADMAYESEIKASMRKQMEDNRRDLENTIEGNASGDYADVLKDGGVKTLDSRDNYGEEKNGATAR